MLVRTVDKGFSALVEHAEMSDQRLERGPIAGGCDHRVDFESSTVGQKGSPVVESLERRDHTDAPAPHSLDEADVENGNHEPPQKVGVWPRGRLEPERG